MWLPEVKFEAVSEVIHYNPSRFRSVGPLSSFLIFFPQVQKRQIPHQVSVGHEERDCAEEEGDGVGGADDPLEDADVGADADEDDEDGPGGQFNTVQTGYKVTSGNEVKFDICRIVD